MNSKNKTIVLLLAVFFGYIGIHRFYVGKVKSGILYLLTGGIFGIGWFVDIILIATGKFETSPQMIKTSSTANSRQTVNKDRTPVKENKRISAAVLPTVQENKNLSYSFDTKDVDFKSENIALDNKEEKTEKAKFFDQPSAEEKHPLISNIKNETVTPDNKEEKTRALKLSSDKVIEKYITTSHATAPSEYSFFEYKRKEFDTILESLKPADIKVTDDFRADNSNFEYKSKNLTTKSNINKVKDFIAIDTETTGLSVKSHKIVEVSAILFKDFKPVSVFHTLINPEKTISKKATEINGITKEMVKDAPRFEQISKCLSDFISGYPLIAHNAEFDMKFLVASGLEISPKVTIYDTLELSRRLFEDAENYKLQTICEECCIYFSNAHRSSSDALAAGLLFNEIIKQRMGTTNLYSLVK